MMSEIGTPLSLSELGGISPEDYDTKLLAAKCRLYGVDDVASVPAAEDSLRRSQPKAGGCPVQWGAKDVAFRCLDCEYDSSCVQCVDCFFEANHSGHDVIMIRTSGGTCDCGDPASWDPAGFCPHHSELQPRLDGPDSLELLPPMIRKSAVEVLPALVAQVDLLISGSSCEEPDDNQDLVHWRRAAHLLVTIGQIGGVAFGLRYIVCQELQDVRLSRWIGAHLAMGGHRLGDGAGNGGSGFGPEGVAFRTAMHDFLLLHAQVSPTFKRRFSCVFAENYRTIAEAEGSHASDLGCLSVQLFTIPEVALELVNERDLLDRLFGLLSELLQPCLEAGDDDGPRSVPERTHRLIRDIGYVLAHPVVSQYVVQTRAAQVALLKALESTWRMNPQRRCTRQHILYERTAHKEAFPIEVFLMQKVGPLADYCQRPEATLEELSAWYSTLAASLAAMPNFYTAFNSTDSASFHLPLQRLLARSVNFELLADPGHAEKWTVIFPEPLIVAMMHHAVRTLRFAADVHDGRWVRNGESMLWQGMQYKRSFRQFDIITVQACFVLIGHHRAVQTASPELVEPLALLWAAAVGDPDPIFSAESTTAAGSDDCTSWTMPGAEESLIQRWRSGLHSVSMKAPGAAPSRREDFRVMSRLRLEFFWELLLRVLNEMLPVEVATCTNRKWRDRYAARCPTILQRCVVQVLARRPLALSEVGAALPKELDAREAQLLEALDVVATRKEKNFTLVSRGWALFDPFTLPLVVGRDTDSHGAEDAAVAQREATLLGPRRADGVSLAPCLQNQLVDSLAASPLAEMLLDLVHHQCLMRLFPKSATEVGALPLDKTFAHALKILDIVYDAGPSGCCSATAAQFCQPPSCGLRAGSCASFRNQAPKSAAAGLRLRVVSLAPLASAASAKPAATPS